MGLLRNSPLCRIPMYMLNATGFVPVSKYIANERSCLNMIKFSPSILSADFTRLGEELSDRAEVGIDYIHVDIMDLKMISITVHF